MGKIEDCFGNLEDAQLYGLAAYEQPMLRLTVEDADMGDVGPGPSSELVYMRALAGIVVSPDVIEPPNPDIIHPAIRIQPISSASFTVAKHPKRVCQTDEYTVSAYDEAHSLLIQRPLAEPEAIKTAVADISRTAKGALTVSRTLPIREVMRELERQRDVHPHGRILHDLSKIALSNIW